MSFSTILFFRHHQFQRIIEIIVTIYELRVTSESNLYVRTSIPQTTIQIFFSKCFYNSSLYCVVTGIAAITFIFSQTLSTIFQSFALQTQSVRTCDYFTVFVPNAAFIPRGDWVANANSTYAVTEVTAFLKIIKKQQSIISSTFL